MKKFLSAILVTAMLFSMMVNVFAEVTSAGTGASSATTFSTVTPGTTYVNKEAGVAYGTEAVGGAELLAVSDTQADYEFTATTNGTTYHYSLLDSQVIDGETQYFIFTNDVYTAPYTNYLLADSSFDPGAEGNNIAKFLNNDFYNDTITIADSTVTTSGSKYNGAYQLYSIDSGIKSYIQNHNWLVEGNSALSNTTMKTDYYANCKIALLSLSEYIMYSDKLGHKAKNNGKMTRSSWYLRSPIAESNGILKNNRIGFVANSSGVVSGDNTLVSSGIKFGIRPCFWVSEDYFRNVKLDGATTGKKVFEILRQTIPKDGYGELYTNDELNDLFGYAWVEDVEAPADYAYSFAVVGDTQILNRYSPQYMTNIYDWLVDNADANKLKFVMGLGDITDADTDA